VLESMLISLEQEGQLNRWEVIGRAF